MSEPFLALTDEQIIEHAQEDANFFILIPIRYFKERGLALEDYAAYAGSVVVKQWPPGLTAKEFAGGLAVNFASLGAEIRSVSGDEVRAEFVVAGWPPEEALKAFGVTREDFDAFWDIPQALAKNLGFDLKWRRDVDVVTMTISR